MKKNLQPQPQPQPQSQGRYTELDNRDWRGRSGQLPASEEERNDFSRRQGLNNQQDQQFARPQISGNQVVINYYQIV